MRTLALILSVLSLAQTAHADNSSALSLDGSVVAHPTPSVNSLAFSGDGKLLVTASRDRTIRVWDIATGHELRRIGGRSSADPWIAVEEKSGTVASSVGDAVRLFDLTTGRELPQLHADSLVAAPLAFTPDGSSLVAGSTDNAPRLWELATGREIARFVGHSDVVTTIAFSPDGRLIASGSNDGTARLWDAASGKETQRFKGHSSWVKSVAFSSDGKLLASASKDGTVRVWITAKSGPSTEQVLTGHSGPIESVAFSPRDYWVASGSQDKSVRVWEPLSGREVRRFEGNAGSIESVTFSPDGRLLAAGSSEGTVKLWDVATANELPPLQIEEMLLYQRFDEGAMAPVPPSIERRPIITATHSIIAHPGDGPDVLGGSMSAAGEVLVRVSNDTKGGNAWGLHVEALDPPAGLIIIPPPIRAKLAPGETVELRVRISWQCPNPDPSPSEATLRLRVTYVHGDGVVIEVPSLHLRSAKFDLAQRPVVEGKNLRVKVKNAGDQDSGLIHIFRIGKGGEFMNPVQINSNIAAGATADFVFPIENEAPPEGQSLPVAVGGPTHTEATLVVTTAEPVNTEFASNVPQISLFAVSSRYHARQWIIPLAPIRSWLDLVLWPIIFVGLFVYQALYGNQFLRRAKKDPKYLFTLPLAHLPDADRALRRVGRLAKTLKHAEITSDRWRRAVDSAKSSVAMFDAFVDVLGAELLSGQCEARPRVTLKFVKFPAHKIKYPLKVVVAAIEGADLEDGTARALPHAVQQVDKGTGNAIVLDLTTTGRVKERLSEVFGVQFVVFSLDSLRNLLLSDRPLDVFEATLVKQLPARELSPYQVSSGVDLDLLFFGRDHEMRMMMARPFRNFFLVGPRQMGKTTILKAIHRRLAKCDDVDVHYVTLVDGDVMAHLVDRLNEGGERRASTPDEFLNVAAGQHGRPRIWLIDEADAFVAFDADRDYAYSRVMRKLAQDGRAYFVLAGYQDLFRVTVCDYDHPLRNFADVLRLGPLDTNAAMELATKPMKDLSITWDSAETVSFLVQGMGARANLIVLTCRAMIESFDGTTRTLTREQLVAQIETNIDLAAALNPIPMHSVLEQAIIHQAFLSDSPTRGSVCARLKEAGLNARSDEFDLAFDRLELAYLLLGNSTGILHCPMPFVREFIARRVVDLDARLKDHVTAWNQIGTSAGPPSFH